MNGIRKGVESHGEENLLKARNSETAQEVSSSADVFSTPRRFSIFNSTQKNSHVVSTYTCDKKLYKLQLFCNRADKFRTIPPVCHLRSI